MSWMPMETSYFVGKGYVERTHSSKIQTSSYFIFWWCFTSLYSPNSTVNK